MAANVESMFYVRETPWHGLGTRVMEAPDSEEALELAGLNWKVRQEPIYTDNNLLIPGYKANVRDLDNKVLGVVTDRYKVVQNDEAFAFTDSEPIRRTKNFKENLFARTVEGNPLIDKAYQMVCAA